MWTISERVRGVREDALYKSTLPLPLLLGRIDCVDVLGEYLQAWLVDSSANQKWFCVLQAVNILIVNISMGMTFPGVEHLQDKITEKAFQSQLFVNILL